MWSYSILVSHYLNTPEGEAMASKHIVYYIYTILELYDEVFTILVINTVKPKKKKVFS